MKDDILEQIDKLKMMVLLEDRKREPSDLERYENWVKKLQGRCHNYNPLKWSEVHDPKDWARYQTIRVLVDNLFYDKNKYDYGYDKLKPEIRRMIAEVVGMTLFIQEEVKDTHAQ